ncbi:hypothetical protein ABW21_db0209535 [Orbilia brochopaga]|nr:hypothetical protein ABW21_db0209535 [Drechslerella brochopaga]
MLTRWDSILTASSSALSLLLFLLLFFTPLTTAQNATSFVSIDGDRDYATARGCVQSALWDDGGGNGRGVDAAPDDVGYGLGCGDLPINGCYCSSAMAASATAYISGYVEGNCSPTASANKYLSTALSIYGKYCKTAGVVEQAATTSKPQGP